MIIFSNPVYLSQWSVNLINPSSLTGKDSPTLQLHLQAGEQLPYIHFIVVQFTLLQWHQKDYIRPWLTAVWKSSKANEFYEGKIHCLGIPGRGIQTLPVQEGTVICWCKSCQEIRIHFVRVLPPVPCSGQCLIAPGLSISYPLDKERATLLFFEGADSGKSVSPEDAWARIYDMEDGDGSRLIKRCELLSVPNWIPIAE